MNNDYRKIVENIFCLYIIMQSFISWISAFVFMLVCVVASEPLLATISNSKLGLWLFCEQVCVLVAASIGVLYTDMKHWD